MIEFTQCLLERRAGGETGVEWVDALQGAARSAAPAAAAATAAQRPCGRDAARKQTRPMKCWCRERKERRD